MAIGLRVHVEAVVVDQVARVAELVRQALLVVKRVVHRDDGRFGVRGRLLRV